MKDFRLNTACSAGNGYFLQAICAELRLPGRGVRGNGVHRARDAGVRAGLRAVPAVGDRATCSGTGGSRRRSSPASPRCSRRTSSSTWRRRPTSRASARRFVLQGGTQRNLAAVKAQVDFIQRQLHAGSRASRTSCCTSIAARPGAIGAGLEAIRLWRAWPRRRRSSASTRPSGSSFQARVRRGYALPLLHERVRADVHRRVDCRRPRPIAPGAVDRAGDRRPAVHRRRRARRAPPRISPRCATSRPRWTRSRRRRRTSSRSRRAKCGSSRRPDRAWPTPCRRPAGVRPARERRALMERRGELRIGIPRVFNMYALRAVLHRLSRKPRRGAGQHRVLRRDEHRDVPRGNQPGRHRPVLPVEGRARARPQPAASSSTSASGSTASSSRCSTSCRRASTGVVANNACPTVLLTPQTVRAAFTKETDLFAQEGVEYLVPLLDLEDRRLIGAADVRHLGAGARPVVGRERAGARSRLRGLG